MAKDNANPKSSKDLQVKTSPPVQNDTHIHDDPAIIQNHYSQAVTTSASLASSAIGSFPDVSAHAPHMGLSKTAFQSSLPMYQPFANQGSWGSSAPPTTNGSAMPMPMYWQGFSGPSNGFQHQPQPLLMPPGLSMPPSMQQPMIYPTMNASLPAGSSVPWNVKPSEPPSTILPPFSMGTPNLHSHMLHVHSPSLTTGSVGDIQSSILPCQSSATVSESSSSLILDEASPQRLQYAVPSTSLPLFSPLTPALDKTNILLPALGKPKTSSESVSSMARTPSSVSAEGSMPPLVTPDQFFQPELTTVSSLQPLQTAQRDVEVVKVSSSELSPTPVPSSKDSQEPKWPLPTPVISKLQEAHALGHRSDRGGRARGGNAFTHQNHRGGHAFTHQNHRGCHAFTHQSHRGGHAFTHQSHRGGHAFTHQSHKGGHEKGGHAYIHQSHRGGRERGGCSFINQSGRGSERGRGNKISRPVARYTEDFDFRAMNEKFNKNEVWSDLGKSNKTLDDGGESKNEEDVEASPSDDTKEMSETAMKNDGDTRMKIRRREHGVMEAILLKKLKDQNISVERNYKGLHADVKEIEEKSLLRWIKEMTVWKEEQKLHRELLTTGIILSKTLISCLLSGTMRLDFVNRSLKVESVVGRKLKVITEQVARLSEELDEELVEDGIGHSSDHFLNALQCLEDASRGTDVKEKLIDCRRHVNMMMEDKSENVGPCDRKGFSTLDSMIKTTWEENAVVSISAKKYREIGFRIFVVLCGFCLKMMPIKGSSGKLLEFMKHIKIRVSSEAIVKEVDQLLKDLLSIKKIRLQAQEMKTHYRRYYYLCKSTKVFFSYPSADSEMVNQLYFDEYTKIIFGLLLEFITKLSSMELYFEENPNKPGCFEECESSLKMLEHAVKDFKIGNELLHRIKERWN